jgi:hypothetical protein
MVELLQVYLFFLFFGCDFYNLIFTGDNITSPVNLNAIVCVYPNGTVNQEALKLSQGVLPIGVKY